MDYLNTQKITEYLQTYYHIYNCPPKWFTSIALTNIPKKLQPKYSGLLDGKDDIVQKFHNIYINSLQVSSWNANKSYQERVIMANKKVNKDSLGNIIFSKISTIQNPIHFDFGSGDGTVALAISNLISATHTYFSDVENFILLDNNDQFIKINDDELLKIPERVNFITASHVFHHLSNIDKINQRLGEIYNALPLGGLLLVREHDVSPNATNDIHPLLRKYNRELVLLMHLCYEINEISKNKTKEEFENWFNQMNLPLMTREQLKNFAMDVGFTIVGESPIRKSDLSYYILFEKIDHLNIVNPIV